MIADANAVMFVADVTNKDTLKEALKWKQELDEIISSSLPSILLVNKSDCNAHYIRPSTLTDFCIENNISQW